MESQDMLVCHCRAVSDRHIRRAVREGARCPGSVAAACGAGTRCGGCRPAIEEILESESGAAERDGLSVLGSLASAAAG